MILKPQHKEKITLILPGGMAKGAFQAGVLSGMVDAGFFDRYTLEAIYGTSIGALNGAFLARGKEDVLKKIWLKWTPLLFYKMLGSGFLKLLLKRFIKPSPTRCPLYFNIFSLATKDDYLVNDSSFESLFEFRKALFAGAASPSWPFFRSVSKIHVKYPNEFSIVNACDGGHKNRFLLPPELKGKVLMIETRSDFEDEGYHGRSIWNEYRASISAYQERCIPRNDVSGIGVIAPKGKINAVYDFTFRSLKNAWEMGYNRGKDFMK